MAKRESPWAPPTSQLTARFSTTLLNSKNDKSEESTTRSGDEDDFLSELVKEYESDDTVVESLENEKLAKLVDKMFRCKLSEKNLKDRLERQERPANCATAKPPRVNSGFGVDWESLQRRGIYNFTKYNKPSQKASCQLSE